MYSQDLGTLRPTSMETSLVYIRWERHYSTRWINLGFLIMVRMKIALLISWISFFWGVLKLLQYFFLVFSLKFLQQLFSGILPDIPYWIITENQKGVLFEITSGILQAYLTGIMLESFNNKTNYYCWVTAHSASIFEIQFSSDLFIYCTTITFFGQNPVTVSDISQRVFFPMISLENFF